MNPLIDKYLIDGCMRCEYGATPRCKVNSWRNELVALREIVLTTGLKEELKWGVPCYTYNGKNICIVSAFKNYASLSFFKGSLLKDPHGLLSKHGENSQAARLFEFTELGQILEIEGIIKQYIQEAIQLEKVGAQVDFKKDLEPMPEELLNLFENDEPFQQAFLRLTPGRQRGYILYFSQPKQSQTRIGRINKCRENILKGIGLHDHYKSGK